MLNANEHGAISQECDGDAPEMREASQGAGKTRQPKVILQRRREARVPVRFRGLLYHGGNYQTTTVENISRHGAGLNGAVGIVPGDNVAIQLLNGRELSGEVVWWLAGRCGIAFHEGLDHGDPLLNGRLANLG